MQTERLDQWEDRGLVGRYIELRDESSFRELYRRHSPSIFGLVLRLSGYDREEAEDTVQETWVRACRKMGEFRWESSLKTWLCSIAVMRTRERRRSRSRRPEESLDPEDAPPRPPAAHGVVSVDLERAIASLPERYRHVLVLRDIEGYTHDEIGRMLEISPGTSKSQLFRARRAIREFLGAGENSDVAEH
jgi:RNA polymerase sigma-70 factor (ECF subfamily)